MVFILIFKGDLEFGVQGLGFKVQGLEPGFSRLGLG